VLKLEQKMKIGEIVRFKQPLIQGEVLDKSLNKETDQKMCLVKLEDADGHDISRWFDEDQLELVDEK
jgi:hypothetical protein